MMVTNAARFRELDGVAGEIEEDLAEAGDVADEDDRAPRVDVGGHLKARGVRAGSQELGGLLHESGRSKGVASSSIMPASILEKSSTSLRQREQGVAGVRSPRRSRPLRGRELGVEQQPAMPRMPLRACGSRG